MRERGVLPSARGDVIRLAPHFYNTLDDVDRALDLARRSRARDVSDAARDVCLPLRRADDDRRRFHRPRPRLALSVHGREVRRRGVRALLHARVGGHRRAGPDGGVRARPPHAPRARGRVPARRAAAREVRRLVLLLRRHRGHRLLLGGDRLGAVLHHRPGGDGRARPVRRRGDPAARPRLRAQVVPPPARVHGDRDPRLRAWSC